MSIQNVIFGYYNAGNHEIPLYLSEVGYLLHLSRAALKDKVAKYMIQTFCSSNKVMSWGFPPAYKVICQWLGLW